MFFLNIYSEENITSSFRSPRNDSSRKFAQSAKQIHYQFCHPEERSDEGSLLAVEILRFAQHWLLRSEAEAHINELV
jgi:hypothetical protein